MRYLYHEPIITDLKNGTVFKFDAWHQPDFWVLIDSPNLLNNERFALNLTTNELLNTKYLWNEMWEDEEGYHGVKVIIYAYSLEEFYKHRSNNSLAPISKVKPRRREEKKL